MGADQKAPAARNDAHDRFHHVHRYQPRALLAWFEKSAALFQKVQSARTGLQVLEALFRYAFTADVEPTQLGPIVVAQLAEEGQEVFMTVADRMIEQGRVEGRIEERARMHRQYAEQLLRLRYGQLDADLLTRMRAFDDARVEALCQTLLAPDFEAIDVEILLFGDGSNR